jgi:hypothetical protein
MCPYLSNRGDIFYEINKEVLVMQSIIKEYLEQVKICGKQFFKNLAVYPLFFTEYVRANKVL